MLLTVSQLGNFEIIMIVKYEELNSIRSKNKGKNISICTGTFDLFHYSHLMFLKYLKERSDILVVVVKSDKDVKAKGKNRPIINEFERTMIVDSIKYTDYTIVSNNIYRSELIDELINDNNYSKKDIYRLMRDGAIFEKIKADTLYVTEDKEIPQVIIDLCKKIKTDIKIIPIQGNDFHTSDIIGKILK